MKILLIGEHFSENLGDQVISECFQEVLKDKKIEYDLLDLSLRNEDKEKEENLCFRKLEGLLKKIEFFQFLFDKHDAKKLLHSFSMKNKEKYDAVIYDGGSIFMNYFVLRVYYLNRLFEKMNAEIFFNACGMGELSGRIYKHYLKRALSSKAVRYISMRDSESKIQKYCSEKVKKTYDIALLSSEIEKFSTQTEKKENVIGIGFMFYKRDFNEIFQRKVENLIEFFEKKGLRWELFTNGSRADYQKMVEFYSKIQKKKVLYGSISERPVSSEELVRIITKYKSILTCRLHSAIIAYSYAIPTYAIEWSPKIREFYKKINHEERALKVDFDVEKVAEDIVFCEYNASDKKKAEEIKKEIKINISSMLGQLGE